VLEPYAIGALEWLQLPRAVRGSGGRMIELIEDLLIVLPEAHKERVTCDCRLCDVQRRAKKIAEEVRG
jgi:hypothetical protein